jgi:hypothetical protein
MRILLFILFIVVRNICIAQVAKDDFAKINQAYVTNSKMTMKTSYELFQNKETKNVFQKEIGEIKRDGNLQYTKLGDIETIRSKEYNVIVDHEDKNISVLGLSADPNSLDEKTYMIDLEKALKSCAKVEFNKENNNQNSYDLELPASEYSEIKIIFNSKTFLLEKMVLYYSELQNLEDKQDGLKERPRLEITYSDIDLRPRFSGSEFTYNKFIEKNGGKLNCKSPFKDYILYDNSIDN